MNLYDVVKRGDRMLDAAPGAIAATVLKLPAGTQRAVKLGGDARVRLRNAHQATCLQHTPRMPGWTLHAPAGAHVEVWLESADQAPHRLAEVETTTAAPLVPAAAMPGFRARLAARIAGGPRFPAPVATQPPTHAPVPIRLDWPMRMPARWDLVLGCNAGEAAIAVGPLRDMRAGLVDGLRGHGVEVGPGANPALASNATRSVCYVEKMPAAEWAATYPKAALDEAVLARWSEYTIASAEVLEGFDDASVDFIFSSHVLEHLVNPLQVLHNWWRCLRPGGVLAAVVPDARHSFDLRQPLTSVEALLAQYRAGGHERTDAMYEQWCRYTAVDATPARLRARDYAIHVNYFSPCSLRAMLEVFRGMVDDPGGVHIEQFRNGKDFAFAMCKPS